MGNWRRERVGEIKQPIQEYIRELIANEKEKGNDVNVIIGTDSQKKRNGINFSTAIVLEVKSLWEQKDDIVTVGRGGMALYRNTFKERKYSLNERMIEEVQMTVNLAYELIPLFDELGCELKLHADINSDPKEKSYSSLNVATNWLSGTGCEWEVKPNAYVATHVADKYCR